MNPRHGVLLLAVCWFAWGFSYPVTRLVLDSVDPWTSRAFIMLAAGALLLAIARLQGHSLVIPRHQRRDLVIAALCNMSIFQVGMTFGVLLLSAGRTAVIVYTMPLWAAILAVPILGERISPRQVIALLLGLAGLTALMSQSLPQLQNAPLGALCTLGASVAFALGTVWMKRRPWEANQTVVAGWQVLLGALPVLVLWYALAPPTDIGAISMESWLAALYLVVIANALAYFAWFRTVAAFPAVVSGIGAMAVPVVGVFSSYFMLDEHIGWRELLALTLICTALALNLLPGRKPA
mgnify:CR=1 FL=1